MMKPESAKLHIAGKALQLPCFFPSVSSVKTNFPPRVYVDILSASKYPLFLISAYDMANSSRADFAHIQKALRRSNANNATILMDSGQYEQYWKKDKSWTVKKFHKISNSCPHHIRFCFDKLEPSPVAGIAADQVVRSVRRDDASISKYIRSNTIKMASVAPIVHGRSNMLDKIAANVAGKLHPLMLAVTERELGDGILERTETVRRIREALNGLDFYCPLHLLGTGNPLSIAIYSMAGADSFDGLEWCQTVVDHGTGQLFHFQQWDFFRHQTGFETKDTLSYEMRVLSHNLEFFKNFMQKLCEDGSLDFRKEFVQKSVAGEHSTQLFRAAGC